MFKGLAEFLVVLILAIKHETIHIELVGSRQDFVGTGGNEHVEVGIFERSPSIRQSTRHATIQ